MEPRIRGICFDLDDTLIAYEPAVRYALTKTANHPALRAARIAPGRFTDAVLAAYFDHYRYGTPGYQRLASLATEDLQDDITRRALETLHLPLDLLPELRTLYRAAEAERLQPMSGAVAVLETLKQRVPLGVITNGPAGLQREKLGRFQLERYFDAIVIDTELGVPKPDPRIFAHAAAALRLPPGELLFVGDTLDADIEGAAAAGWHTAWLTDREGATPSQGYRIHCLSELLELQAVAALLQRSVKEVGPPADKIQGGTEVQ